MTTTLRTVRTLTYLLRRIRVRSVVAGFSGRYRIGLEPLRQRLRQDFVMKKPDDVVEHPVKTHRAAELRVAPENRLDLRGTRIFQRTVDISLQLAIGGARPAGARTAPGLAARGRGYRGERRHAAWARVPALVR